MGGLTYLYLLNVTVHVTAAVLWLGGTFFLALVGAPVLGKVEPPALRASLFAELGRRFRSLGWIALGLLLVTGTLNLYFRGVLTAVSMGSSHLWRTPFGRTLALKLFLVALMLLIQALHDFRWGPTASRAQPGTPAAAAFRRRAALAARADAVLGLLILIAAVRLARGG
jgi:putative copper export protein